MPLTNNPIDRGEGIYPNGSQADSVRLKIATLLDEATLHTPFSARPSLADVKPQPLTPSEEKPRATNTANGVNSPFFGQPSQPEEPTPPPIENSSPALRAPESAINIKGRGDGVVIEIGIGNWSDLVADLNERLLRAANFFRGGKVALDIGVRSLREDELQRMQALFTQHAMQLVVVRTTVSETFQAALALGLAVKLETVDSKSAVEALPAAANWEEEHHFVYRGHLRAGQILDRKEHILIIGDVNPGATVVSNGDILVWGNLRGVAHAGAEGDIHSVIVALNLSPLQLRIADLIAVADDGQEQKKGWRFWKRLTTQQPEIAYLNGDRIQVEPWDASRFGGIAAFRRNS